MGEQILFDFIEHLVLSYTTSNKLVLWLTKSQHFLTYSFSLFLQSITHILYFVSLTGPHFLDESQFMTEFLSDSVLNVQWEILDNVTASDLNVTLKYHIIGIGDCVNVTDPAINEM